MNSKKQNNNNIELNIKNLKKRKMTIAVIKKISVKKIKKLSITL
jgi:hypothetical protein